MNMAERGIRTLRNDSDRDGSPMRSGRGRLGIRIKRNATNSGVALPAEEAFVKLLGADQIQNGCPEERIGNGVVVDG